MPDEPRNLRNPRGAALAAAAFAVIAGSAGLYLVRSPREASWGLGRFFGGRNRAELSVAAVLRDVERGDESQRAEALGRLRAVPPGQLGPAVPALVRALGDPSRSVRVAAATAVGDLAPRLGTQGAAAEAALADLLDDPWPVPRAEAAKALGALAEAGRLAHAPDRLVARLDDPDELVRARAAGALVWYGDGPERLVPVALRRIPDESAGTLGAFIEVFWYVRLEPPALPFLTAGMSSEHDEVRLVCAAAVNHMGAAARPAVSDVLTLIRRELDRPRPPGTDENRRDRILGMAAGAVGEITAPGECPPGAVELLVGVLRRPRRSQPRAATNPADPAAGVLGPEEETVAEAVWSLGIMGRAAAPALRSLLDTFAAAPEPSNLRGLTAEALAEVGRGTPDGERVRDALARAWPSAPPRQKAALARALRRLGPGSERLVAGLEDWPDDNQGSQIRRVRYPRSRRGVPVRE